MYDQKPTRNPDMRERVSFPRPPQCKEDIFGSPVEPWLMACSLVNKYDRWQLNTYRKMYNVLGDELYRNILEVTRVIFVESRNIIAPAAFLSAQFKLAAAGKEIFQ